MQKIKNILFIIFYKLGLNRVFYFKLFGSFMKKFKFIDTQLHIFEKMKLVENIEDHVDLIKPRMDKYWTEEKINLSLKELENCNANWMKNYHTTLIGNQILGKYSTILDYGCGNGFHSFVNKKIFTECKFYMNDIAYLSIPKLYEALKNQFENEDMIFVNKTTDELLKKCDLIYSALTFSLMPPRQLNYILHKFYKNKCDLLATSNSFINQSANIEAQISKPYNDFRDLRWSHNYKKYLKKVGYKLNYLETLTHDELDNKKLVIFYATIS